MRLVALPRYGGYELSRCCSALALWEDVGREVRSGGVENKKLCFVLWGLRRSRGGWSGGLVGVGVVGMGVNAWGSDVGELQRRPVPICLPSQAPAGNPRN